jgi:hypothetical protein
MTPQLSANIPMVRSWSIALAMLGLMTVFGPASVQARPSNSVETDYYADRQKTRLVGHTELLCSGGVVRQGRRTSFFTRTSSPCGRAGANPQ